MAAPETANGLRPRFLALWERCRVKGGDGADPEAVWNELVRHYSEVHRFYHDFGHLRHCLEQLDLAADGIGNAGAVEMALWFHDVVLEPQSPDNEARSAELFERTAAGVFRGDFTVQVAGLILATTHRESPSTPDQEVMVDIDLSSFGLPWERYLRDTLALRQEIPQLEDERYNRAHRRFLESLVGRGRIFHTDFFHRRYETAARDNIARYLRQLDSGAGLDRVPRP